MRFKGMDGEWSSDKQKEPDFLQPDSPYTNKTLDFDIRLFCAACGKVISHSHYKLPQAKPCKCGSTTFTIRYRAEEYISLGRVPKRLKTDNARPL
jgi:hypothetical protein